MKIIIEVGTDEQKKQIASELRFVEKAIAAFEPPLNIIEVIVPADFDQRVNELQKTDYYKSVRGMVALAKMLELDDGVAIILSPSIYTMDWDTQKRLYVYLHEVFHVDNKRRIIKPQVLSPSSSLYYENLYRIYDEYAADRKTFELIDDLFPLKSDLMQSSINWNVDGFTQAINSSKYYEQISHEITSFRIHANVITFLQNTHDSVSEVTMSIAHLYAYIDNYPNYQNKVADLANSKFINNKTFALIEFFRKQYSDNSHELTNGLRVISEFMLNFGMGFEDIAQGLYCHVIDI
jgi:hypothetical protein